MSRQTLIIIIVILLIVIGILVYRGGLFNKVVVVQPANQTPSPTAMEETPTSKPTQLPTTTTAPTHEATPTHKPTEAPTSSY